jgi:hypothetical protein
MGELHGKPSSALFEEDQANADGPCFCSPQPGLGHPLGWPRPMSEKSPASNQTSLIPWVLVACLALAAALATRLYVAARAEAVSERLQASLADLELRSTRNQLEAEKILSRREIEDLSQEL